MSDLIDHDQEFILAGTNCGYSDHADINAAKKHKTKRNSNS